MTATAETCQPVLYLVTGLFTFLQDVIY